MKRNTIRSLFWGALVAALILFALMLWDHFGNEAAWLVPLLLLFIGLLVFMLLMLLLRPDPESDEFEPIVVPDEEPEPTEPTAPSAYYDYKGDIDDVIDVEGIGPVYAEKLKAIGIETTARLCYEDAEHIADKVGTHLKTVKGWQTMAELMKVKGIAGQYAEALLRGGIDGIAALKKGDAAKIAASVTAYMDSIETNLEGNKITARRVQGWQKAAQPMRRVRQPIPEK